MENEKMNKRLVEELNGVKSWMKFLDNKGNFNKSFHKPTAKNPKLLREFGNVPDGSPEQTSDDLILGADQKESMNNGSFIVISIDINGGIHVAMVEGEDENDVLQQTENEIIIQNMVIAEDSLTDLIAKLSQYLPEEVNAEVTPEKPPFIDQPDDEVIDEDYI